MSRKIFFSILWVSLAILLLSMIFMGIVFYNITEEYSLSELRSEAGYIAQAVENEGEIYLHMIKDRSKRITLIAPDGVVLYDNSVEASTLENHSEREEVREAIEGGSGDSVRMSKTITKTTIYYAQKLSDGSVLRISVSKSSVLSVFLNMWFPLLFGILAVVSVAVVVGRRVSDNIVKPINAIDLEKPLENETYEEITPLLTKIVRLNKTIAKQLDESERRRKEFMLITENMSEGFLVINSNKIILSYNSSALRLLEAEGAEENMSVLALNRSDAFREVIDNALKGGHYEGILRREEKVYQLIGSPVSHHGEGVVGAVILILDITEKEKREVLRREFTANVSHELKTPLTSILGFAELLKDGKVAHENIADFCGSIYDEAKRLITLVNDIIKLSEFDEERIEEEKEKVDLREIAEEVRDRLSNVAKSRNVTIKVGGDSANISGIRNILLEMVYNLADNAVKYSNEGGSIDITVSKGISGASITVKDRGIGIPYQYRDRVFERFFRVDKSRSKQVGGTGLGLSIVRHGARMHGATVSVTSKENLGTSITLIFNLKSK